MWSRLRCEESTFRSTRKAVVISNEENRNREEQSSQISTFPGIHLVKKSERVKGQHKSVEKQPTVHDSERLPLSSHCLI